MPIVHVSIVEGRDDLKIKACIKAVAHAVHESLDAPLDAIRVYVTQVPAAHWGVGDRTKDETATVSREAA